MKISNWFYLNLNTNQIMFIYKLTLSCCGANVLRRNGAKGWWIEYSSISFFCSQRNVFARRNISLRKWAKKKRASARNRRGRRNGRCFRNEADDKEGRWFELEIWLNGRRHQMMNVERRFANWPRIHNNEWIKIIITSTTKYITNITCL